MDEADTERWGYTGDKPPCAHLIALRNTLAEHGLTVYTENLTGGGVSVCCGCSQCIPASTHERLRLHNNWQPLSPYPPPLTVLSVGGSKDSRLPQVRVSVDLHCGDLTVGVVTAMWASAADRERAEQMVCEEISTALARTGFSDAAECEGRAAAIGTGMLHDAHGRGTLCLTPQGWVFK